MTCNVVFDRLAPSDVVLPKHTTTLLGAELKAWGKLISWVDVPAVTDIVLLPPWWDTDYRVFSYPRISPPLELRSSVPNVASTLKPNTA